MHLRYCPHPPEVFVGCYSKEFTLAVLEDKPYFDRLSAHLISQLIELSCDRLTYFTRALDAMEEGSPITSNPGAFGSGGVLAGYGHIHFKREDWASGNLALLHRKRPSQKMDETIRQIVLSLLDSGKGYEGIQAEAERFRTRISTQATGDWILYRENAKGIQYLAIHEHTKRGSQEELQLRSLLDSLSGEAM